MVFSFPRLRKAKDNGASSVQLPSQNKVGFKFSKKAKGDTAVKQIAGTRKRAPIGVSISTSRNFQSPPSVLEEGIPKTIDTDLTHPATPSTPIIANLSVVVDNDDHYGTEVFFADSPSESPQVESSDSLINESKAEVKRQLFLPPEHAEEPPDLVNESKATSKAELPQSESQTLEPEIDEPFDEKEMKKEDPYILEVIQSEANPISWRLTAKKVHDLLNFSQPLDKQIASPEKSLSESQELDSPTERETSGKASFLEMFKCMDDTSLFYDTLCTTGPVLKKQKRPYFNEMFALNFILEATINGIPMLYYIPPSNPVDNDWAGRSVTMFIQPGHCKGPFIVHPKLVWKSPPGDWSRRSGSDKLLIEIDLLEIHCVMDSIEDDTTESTDDGDTCVFSITTNSGDIHLFESFSEIERDRVVSGIKNVIARMSYSIILGDNHLMTELYGEGEQDEGELPALKTDAQALADITHSFLDSAATPQNSLPSTLASM